MRRPGILIFLITCCGIASFAQSAQDFFRPIGLPSSRSTSPVFNRYASLPPFTAEQPKRGEWFCVPTFELSQGMLAAWMYDSYGVPYPATQLDCETFSLELPLAYGLTDTVSLELDLQVQYLSGGFLDIVIESFHGLFGFPNGGRELFDRNRVEVDIPTMNGFDLRMDSSALLVADPVFGVGLGLAKTDRTTLTGRLLAALPLGLGAGLSGAELPQLGAALYAGWMPHSRITVNASVGGVLPLESFGWTASKPYPTAHARASILAEAAPGFFLLADFNFRTSPISSTIRYDGVDFYAMPNADLLIAFVFTGRKEKERGLFGSFSFQEDPFSHNAADIGFKGSGAFRW